MSLSCVYTTNPVTYYCLSLWACWRWYLQMDSPVCQLYHTQNTHVHLLSLHFFPSESSLGFNPRRHSNPLDYNDSSVTNLLWDLGKPWPPWASRSLPIEGRRWEIFQGGFHIAPWTICIVTGNLAFDWWHLAITGVTCTFSDCLAPSCLCAVNVRLCHLLPLWNSGSWSFPSAVLLWAFRKCANHQLMQEVSHTVCLCL